MDTLMKARLSDFRKKAARKQSSLQRQTQESVEIEEAAGTQAPGVEVLGTPDETCSRRYLWQSGSRRTCPV